MAKSIEPKRLNPMVCIRLLLTGDSDLSLERGKVEEILFNWNTWRLIARAGHLGLQLVSAAVRLAAVRWVDSHIWLLERNLPWINQADGDRQHEHLMPQHLAAQMAVALKPYAGHFQFDQSTKKKLHQLE